jgi:3'-5' exoribonuclease
MDKTGEISGPVWENAERRQALCVPGEVVRVAGIVQSYRDNPQLKIDDIGSVAQAEIDLADFLPASNRCRREMAEELRVVIQSVKNPFLKKLLNHFLSKSDWWSRFQESPAAKGIHHAYIGGLLEHSLSVAQVAVLLADHYEGVDRSLLVAGALLHDIGKLEELSVKAGLIEYTVRGRLKGHLVMGSEMVAVAAAKISDFPVELLEQLQHLILSHHGRHEFGSPAVPMTVEALILSFLDDLDAKMNITEQLRRKMDSTEMGWTEYQRMLERYLYLGGFEKSDESTGDGQNEQNDRRQQSLF